MFWNRKEKRQMKSKNKLNDAQMKEILDAAKAVEDSCNGDKKLLAYVSAMYRKENGL